jgi:hypothetical protein
MKSAQGEILTGELRMHIAVSVKNIIQAALTTVDNRLSKTRIPMVSG